MFRLLLLSLTVLLLSACEEAGPDSFAEADLQAASAPMQDMAGEIPTGADGASRSAQSYLAYRYIYEFALPAAAVTPTVEAHVQACLDAGPTRCQILSRTTQAFNDDNVRADLRLRAEPSWLESYAESLIDSVDAADGRVVGTNVSAEDLTRQILDVDARLNAQMTLRDRLRTLLETREAELSDLLELERELARVQGEIESATSTLNALRQRVTMSIVDVSYRTKRSAVSGSVAAPIGDALNDFFRLVSESLAAIIRFLALVLPFLIFLILPSVYLTRWWMRRRSLVWDHKRGKPVPKA